MAYATYDDFRSGVLALIDGDDFSPSATSMASLDQMIALGEALVHYGNSNELGPLRASSMEVELTGTVASNAVAIPDDCMELSILWLDGGEPLDIVSEIDVRKRLPWIGGGKPRKAAQAGDTIIFSPVAADGAALGGRYYAKPAALKDGLHATFNRYPELYLYAALISATPFFGFNDQIPIWQQFYATLLAQANRQERMRVHAGGRLRTVAR